jgi:phosphotransferase system HPr (HPr) family protein
MNGEICQRQVTIVNPQGFHMRPVTLFAQTAGRFQSTVTLRKDDQRVNGKSPLELMVLGAEQGTELTLEVSGPDAPAAIDVLARILEAPSADDLPGPDDLVPPKG